MKNLKDLRIVFFGSPPLAEATLNALHGAGFTPALIVTEPDHTSRRGKDPVPSTIRLWGEKNGIEVLQPLSLTDETTIEPILNSEWDLFIVAAWGKLLSKKLLDLPKLGVLNIHPSLLPKYRGASPIRSQILADDRLCGVTIMKLDEQMDHGPIVAQASVEPDPWPLPGLTLDELLAEAGANLLVEVLPDYAAGTITLEEQDHTAAAFVKKIQKEDGLLDLADDPYQNYLKICAYEGWPGTYFFASKKDGSKIRVKIADAEFENNTLTLLRVIPEGKKEMDYEDFLRGL